MLPTPWTGRSFGKNTTVVAFAALISEACIFDHAIRVKQRDLFLHATYEFPNPQHYAIIACPDCYYSAYDKDFEALPDKLNSQQIFQLQQALKKGKDTFHLNLSKERALQEVIDLYNLAVLTHLIAEDSYKMAQLYMKLGWFYLDDQNRGECGYRVF